MTAKRLNTAELKEVCGIMSIGNTALKECAEMMGMKQQEFRGKFLAEHRPSKSLKRSVKLDTSKLTPEQVEKLNAATPLILTVHDQCQEKVQANFTKMVVQQAWLAAQNNYDPKNAKEEFMQEGEMAVLNGIYGYTDTKIALSTYMWQCIRRRIFDAVNRLNPLCPLTNEAIDLVRRVHEVQNENSDLTDEQAVEVLGFTSDETEVFFRSMTKVMNEEKPADDGPINYGGRGSPHDDYTSKRRGVDRDFHEVFFIRKDARQAIKDADLDEFELECLFNDTFPYHGWKEDVANKHINPRTNERFTRQNVQYALERAKAKVRKAYLHPPKVHLENPAVDKFFDEWNTERAVREDRK
jgi:DNA-directed RNA polymerase specialized sigma subunit